MSFLVANYVDPYARMNMRAMIANASADLMNVIVQEGNFRKLADNLYIQVAERRADGSIGGLFIADSAIRRSISSIMPPMARLLRRRPATCC